MYRRTVIAGVQPLLAQHFNLTVELPLKSIVRGYRYAIVPNTWINRNQDVSKFKIKEMGSRYFSSRSIGSSKRLWGTQICGHPRSCARRSSRCGTVETGVRASPVSNDSS